MRDKRIHWINELRRLEIRKKKQKKQGEECVAVLRTMMHHLCSFTPGPLAGGRHRAWGTVSLMAGLTVLSTGALCGANGPRVLIYDRKSQMNAGDVLLRLCCCASHRRLRVGLTSIWRRGAGGWDVQHLPPRL